MPGLARIDDRGYGPMNPTVIAMRRPVTTMMMVVALISGGVLAYNRMRVDIFPALNVPKVYVFLDYIGMSPDQMEGFIVNQLELFFQYVDGIQDINTRNIQQVALTELSFFPGTDMGQAMAQVVAMSNRAMSWMPKGTLPPMIMRMDAGSVPVGYLVFKSKEISLGAMGDMAQNVVRPLVQKLVPGTVAISPFGPNMRSIIINVDPQKMLDYNLTPQEIITALATGNTIIPAGNLYVHDSMPIVSNNATVIDIQAMGSIPLRMERNVYLRDIATIQDDVDITYGYALVNGRKSVYLPIIKKDTGSTLTVVADIHKAMKRFRESVPKEVEVSFEFDESPTVVAAVESVATEGMIGAGLTGLMILLFLQDWRSVIVVVSNIPLALLGSLFGLWATGNTINIMSLGGMALAIGILVDEATVTIENVHVQMNHTPHVATSVLHASNATAVPRLLALLCILSVFIPAFIMTDPLRSLFMPLTLGVGFAMISSYILSSTFVPIMCVALLKHHGGHGHGEQQKEGLFDKFLKVYGRGVHWFVHLRWLVVPIYLGACGLVLWILGMQVGTELFPQIDSGQFVLRFRPPPGSNFELTRQMAIKCFEEVEREAGPGHIQITMGYVGQVPPNFGINNMVLFMRGPDDGQLRVAFTEDTKIRLDRFREREVSARSPAQERDPLDGEAVAGGGIGGGGGAAAGEAVHLRLRAGRHRDQRHELRLVDADRRPDRRHRPEDGAAARREDRRQHEEDRAPARRHVRADARLSLGRGRDRSREGGAQRRQGRRRATGAGPGDGIDPIRQPQLLGRHQDGVRLPGAAPGAAAADGEAGGRRDPAAGVGQPAGQPDGPRRGDRAPGRAARRDRPRHVAALPDHHGQRRGRGHGPGVADQVKEALLAAGDPPRGVVVETMGQLPPMNEMFTSLTFGLGVAVFVIFVLLTAYFQSPRLSLIAVGAVPGVLAGIATILYFTNTSLNIESFMGSIMCLGVSVSNSVMLVTFIDEHWKRGTHAVEAAILGASERLRPILMTACAMTVGMVPMALALEKGSQMQAPLGLAVIGGLVMSTFATLLVVPSIFAVVIGNKVARSPSIYPDDPESAHYDPNVYAEQHHSGHDAGHAAGGDLPAESYAEKRRASTSTRPHGQERSRKPSTDLGICRTKLLAGPVVHPGRVP